MRESDAAVLTAAKPEQMRAFGDELARALRAHLQATCVVHLSGELGAGKTTFVGGLLAGFGFKGSVRSPTYTLIEPYELAGRSLYHLDLYRLTDPGEIENLGLRDLLDRGAILLIEWPERGCGMLPDADLQIDIAYSSGVGHEGRILSLKARTPLGLGLLGQMVQ